MEKTVYKKIINDIVKEIDLLIGPIAIMQANNIIGLKVNATGNVDVKGNPVKKIEELVDGYEVLIGPVAVTIARMAVKPYLEKNKKLKIPDELREK